MSFSLSSILSPPEQIPNPQSPPLVRTSYPRLTVDLTAHSPPQRHRDDRFYNQSRSAQHHYPFQFQQQLPPRHPASCLNSEAHRRPPGYHISSSSEYGNSSPIHNFLNTNRHMETQSQPNLSYMNRQMPHQITAWSFPSQHFPPGDIYEEDNLDNLYHHNHNDETPEISQEGFSSIDDLESILSETEAGSIVEENSEESERHLNAPVDQAPNNRNVHFGYGTSMLSSFLDLTNTSSNPADDDSAPQTNHNSNMPAATTRPNRKRSFAEISDDAGPSASASANSKRRRTSTSGRSHPSGTARGPPPRTKSREEIDLVAEEEEEANALAQALAKQRAEAVKAQQQPNADDGKKSKLSMLQCTVCLDVTEDLTATTCGKFSYVFTSADFMFNMLIIL